MLRYPLALPQQLTIILTCTLASVGTAGVPGAGAVMLGMVLQSVGLPVEGIAWWPALTGFWTWGAPP